jgi:hypothetical protein
MGLTVSTYSREIIAIIIEHKSVLLRAKDIFLVETFENDGHAKCVSMYVVYFYVEYSLAHVIKMGY